MPTPHRNNTRIQKCSSKSLEPNQSPGGEEGETDRCLEHKELQIFAHTLSALASGPKFFFFKGDTEVDFTLPVQIPDEEQVRFCCSLF